MTLVCFDHLVGEQTTSRFTPTEVFRFDHHCTWLGPPAANAKARDEVQEWNGRHLAATGCFVASGDGVAFPTVPELLF